MMTKGEMLLNKIEKFKADLIKDYKAFVDDAQPVHCEASLKLAEEMGEHMARLVQPVRDIQLKINDLNTEISRLKSDRVVAEINGEINDLQSIEAMIDERVSIIQNLEREIKNRHASNQVFTPDMLKHKAAPLLASMNKDAQRNAEIQDQCEKIRHEIEDLKFFFRREVGSMGPEKYSGGAIIGGYAEYIIPGLCEHIQTGNHPSDLIDWAVRFYQPPAASESESYGFFKAKK